MLTTSVAGLYLDMDRIRPTCCTARPSQRKPTLPSVTLSFLAVLFERVPEMHRVLVSYRAPLIAPYKLTTQLMHYLRRFRSK